LANEVSVIALVGRQHLGCWPVTINDWRIAFVIGDFATGGGVERLVCRRGLNARSKAIRRAGELI
jgi:hypothetical protein